jgi:hypothetical protein
LKLDIDEGKEPDPAKPGKVDLLTHAKKGDGKKKDERADRWDQLGVKPLGP